MIKLVTRNILEKEPTITDEELYLRVVKDIVGNSVEDMCVGEFFRNNDELGIPKMSTVLRYRRFYRDIL